MQPRAGKADTKKSPRMTPATRRYLLDPDDYIKRGLPMKSVDMDIVNDMANRRAWGREADDEVVYFIRAGNGPVKIGHVMRRVTLGERMDMLQTGNAEPLRFLAATKGTITMERLLHKLFSHLRINGEWFKPGDDLMQYIDQFIHGVAQ